MKKENMTCQREALEVLSSARLEEMLKAELNKDGMDENLVLLILNILEHREVDGLIIDPADMEAVWTQFQGSHPALAPPRTKDVPAAKRTGPRRWLCRLAVAAAVLCVMILVTPKAMGAENIFTIIGRWTQDVFAFFSSFGTEQTIQGYAFETDHPGLRQIYDAVAELGVTKPVVPTWVPEGYELKELKAAPMREGMKIYGRLIKGDSTIILSYEFYSEAVSNTYEKNQENAAVYEFADVKHYIMSNEEWWTAAWAVEDLECSVATDQSKEILYEILRSIYTEGD